MTSLETEPVLDNYLLEIKEEPTLYDEFLGQEFSSNACESLNDIQCENNLQFYLFEDGDLKRVRNNNNNSELEIKILSDDNLKCKLCGKTFKYQRTLQKHIGSHEVSIYTFSNDISDI